MFQNKSSLYRIYRPSTFNDVAGHTNVVTILKTELANNSFTHAFLFAGQRGTGKTSVARIFAKAVNCLNLENGNPCDKCESCIAANEGKSPDIFEIDAASNNGVDEIRNVKSNVTTLPILGKYKVYIIDEVHMLSKGAFNALLKTLEEPPAHALFILATTEYAKIPATIVSRCQTFNFKKIDKNALEARLEFIAKQEGFTIDAETKEEIYYLSDGSLRDALNMLEQLMIVNDSNITVDSLKNIFYVASKKEKFAIIKNMIDGKADQLIQYFENAENQGMDYDVFALSLIEMIKEIIEYKLTNNQNYLKLTTVDEINSLNTGVQTLFSIADNLSEAYAKTKGTNVNFNYILISILKNVVVSEPVAIQPAVPPIETLKEHPTEERVIQPTKPIETFNLQSQPITEQPRIKVEEPIQEVKHVAETTPKFAPERSWIEKDDEDETIETQQELSLEDTTTKDLVVEETLVDETIEPIEESEVSLSEPTTNTVEEEIETVIEELTLEDTFAGIPTEDPSVAVTVAIASETIAERPAEKVLETIKEPEFKTLSDLFELQAQIAINSSSTTAPVKAEVDDVINMLQGALKDGREAIHNKIDSWFNADENGNLLTPTKAKDFVAFKSGKVSAVSPSEILIVAESNTMANAMNSVLSNAKTREKLFNEFGHPYTVLVIEPNKWEAVKKEFGIRRANSGLFGYKSTNPSEFYAKAISKATNSNPEAKELLDAANTLFGTDIEVKIND